jgi:hypothetical protein
MMIGGAIVVATIIGLIAYGASETVASHIGM